MANKKLVALSLICVVLSVGIVSAVMVVNQKDIELKTKTEQISGLENEKLTLKHRLQPCKPTFQVSNLKPIH